MSTKPHSDSLNRGGRARLAVGEVISGRYQVEAPIADGGHGATYRILDIKDGLRPKVIKTLFSDSAKTDRVGQLAKEFETLRRVAHPGVVKCEDYGIHSSIGPYFVMELLEWPTLNEIERDLTQSQIVRILYELSTTLHAIHVSGVLHLDLKPDNIFVNRSALDGNSVDDGLIVKIADFGLAHWSGPSDEGDIYGNFVYSSPERFESKKADFRSDIYSIGMIGYVLLTRRIPYDQSSNVPLGVQKKCFSPTTEVWPKDTPQSLSILITRALQPSPSFRPTSARELAAELSSLLPTQIRTTTYLPNSPFVGRTSTNRQLGSLLSEVADGQHWAISISGEEGIGKSRVMSEFILQKKLAGYRCYQLEGNGVNSLQLELDWEIPSAREGRESSNPLDVFQTLLETAGKEPLVIAWHRFDKVEPSLILSFTNFFIRNRALPILWLLEADKDPSEFASLEYSDRMVRLKLPELSNDALVEMVGHMLLRPAGYEDLSVSLFSKIGRKPGRIVLALRELIRKGKITLQSGTWTISDTKLEDWRETLGQTWAFNPEGMSTVSLSLVQWLSVIDRTCNIDEVSQSLEITDELVREIIRGLEERGLLIVDRETIRLSQPIVQEQIYRSIQPRLRDQTHFAVGRWMEEQLGQSASLTDFMNIARHYNIAGKTPEFRRITLTAVIRSDENGRLDADPTLLKRALELSADVWKDDIRLRGYEWLGQILVSKKRYAESADLYKWLLEDKSLGQLIDVPKTELFLGRILLKAGRSSEAIPFLQNAIRSLENSRPSDVVSALITLGFAYSAVGTNHLAIDCSRKCSKLIKSEFDLKTEPQLYLEFALLLIRIGKVSQAKQIYEALANLNSSAIPAITLFQAKIGVIQLKLRNGETTQCLRLLEKLERQMPLDPPPTSRWLIPFYRVVLLLAEGDNQSAFDLTDKAWPEIQLSASTQDQIRLLLNTIRAGYYTGEFGRANLYIRQAMLIAKRSENSDMRSVLLTWALCVRSMVSFNSLRLEQLVSKLLSDLPGPLTKTLGRYLLAEYYLLAHNYEKVVPLLSDSDIGASDIGIPEHTLNSMRTLASIKLGHPTNILSSSEATNENEQEYDLYTKGKTHYWLLNVSLETGSREQAKHHFNMAMMSFKKLEANYWIGLTKSAYGSHISEFDKDPKGQALINEAIALYKSLGLPTFSNTNTDELTTVHQMAEQSRHMTLPIKELAEILESLNSSTNPENLTRRLLEIAMQAMGASRGLIFFKRAKMPGLSSRFAIRIALDEEQLISRSVVEQVYSTGQPVFSDDAIQDDFLRNLQSIRLANIRTVACLPIVSEKEIVGVIYLDSENEALSLSETQQHYLKMIGHLIGTIITHSRLLHSLRSDVVALRKTVEIREGYGEIKGKSSAIQEVFRRLTLVKGYDVPVLIIGESGTGKELIARTIHRESGRSQGHLVAVNCASFPEHLIESLLFGHVKGSFTGANSNHLGYFEQAHGGTIFLDEVEETSWGMQGKLLRVLEDGEYYRIGESTPRHCNVRLITAGKPSLLKRVEAGTFRHDLYYRMKVVQIDIPPLNSRREDIPVLISHFLLKFKNQYNKEIKGIGEDALKAILRYYWPGNVRQLEHCIQQAFLFASSGDWIKLDHLPDELRSTSGAGTVQAGSLANRMERYEAEQIRIALIENDGDHEKTHQKLELSRSSYYRKLKLYGLDRLNPNAVVTQGKKPKSQNWES